MAGILHTAASKLNANVAGQTQIAGAPTNEGHHAQSITGSEALGALPTEFGGLTHLFNGDGTAAHYAPVELARSVPTAQRGPNGGLVPDFRNTAQKTEQAVKAAPAKVVTPVSTTAKNTLATIRQRLKI